MRNTITMSLLENIEFGTIYHVDAIEFMKQLPDHSIDMILTSPPFKDEDVPGEYWEFFDSALREMLRVTKNVVCVVHSATKMQTIYQRYPPKRTIIWGKGIVSYSWRYNPIYVYQIGDHYKVNKYIFTDCVGVPPIKGKDKSHKYQDPLALYELILKMFKGNTLVLDPFAGAGTCRTAAENIGMKFIGCDIAPEWADAIPLRMTEVES